jgi:hypothetical protein
MSAGISRELLLFVESCYIRSLRAIGHDLTNTTDGGVGGNTEIYLTDAEKAAKTAKWRQTNVIQNMKIASAKRWSNPDEHTKLGEAVKEGHARMSPEAHADMRRRWCETYARRTPEQRAASAEKDRATKRTNAEARRKVEGRTSV